MGSLTYLFRNPRRIPYPNLTCQTVRCDHCGQDTCRTRYWPENCRIYQEIVENSEALCDEIEQSLLQDAANALAAGVGGPWRDAMVRRLRWMAWTLGLHPPVPPPRG